MKKLFLPFISIIAASCSDSEIVKEQQVTSLKVPTEVHGDTLSIFGPLLLFMWPDSLQAEQMKSKDSDAFYAAADDYSFYNSQLMDIADSMGIKNFNTSSKFLDFNTFSNKYFIIDRASSEDLWWGLYIFNGKDKPLLQSTVEIDTKFLNSYFKK